MSVLEKANVATRETVGQLEQRYGQGHDPPLPNPDDPGEGGEQYRAQVSDPGSPQGHIFGPQPQTDPRNMWRGYR